MEINEYYNTLQELVKLKQYKKMKRKIQVMTLD
jgi:hypothetical protein